MKRGGGGDCGCELTMIKKGDGGKVVMVKVKK